MLYLVSPQPEGIFKSNSSKSFPSKPFELPTFGTCVGVGAGSGVTTGERTCKIQVTTLWLWRGLYWSTFVHKKQKPLRPGWASINARLVFQTQFTSIQSATSTPLKNLATVERPQGVAKNHDSKSSNMYNCRSKICPYLPSFHGWIWSYSTNK